MSTATLVVYDEACRALAEAHRIDEVKDIADKATALALYAKQVKNGEMIAQATAIRKRAERRLGELMAESPKAKPPNPKRRVAKRPDDPPTLAEQGVDKHLADRARKAAAMPEEAFEADVAKTVKVAVAATEGDREVTQAARAERQEKKRARRQERELDLAAKITALPNKHGVIYADPPWRFEAYSAETGMDRAADNQYPTMDIEAIKALPVPAAADCVLFLWVTAPMLPAALEVMAAWRFTYKSLLVREKDRDGTRYWTRNRVEVLLIGTRGDIPAPAPGEQLPQLIKAPRGRHSEKPAIFAELIEKLYPNVPKLEMFARAPRAGWDVWGNEVESVAGNDVPTEQSAEEMKQTMAAFADGDLSIPDFLRRDDSMTPSASNN